MDTTTPDKLLRTLIWVYFILWILEGSLRKWIFPQLADPLLIVRDPVAIAIYAVALREGSFPKSFFLAIFYGIATFSLAVSLFIDNLSLAVNAFGFRTNFLHLPLIFIMADVLRKEDLIWFGRGLFFLAPAMATLMAFQFLAPEDSWLNRGASKGALQIGTSLGHIRPAGFFSYNTGAGQYLCLTLAFLLAGWIKKWYSTNSLLLGAGSVLLAVSVSGSRTTVISVGIVIGTFVMTTVRSNQLARGFQVVLAMTVLVLIMATTGLFQEGFETMTTRFDEAHGGEGSMWTRILSDYWIPLHDKSWFGIGLGIGTNVGAKLTFGEVGFLLAEGEWERILGESGIILGGAFILWRCGLTFHLLVRSLLARATQGPLPLLLFSASANVLIVGQWGQATAAGFAVFCGGLCLAACRAEAPAGTLAGEEDSDPEAPELIGTSRVLKGRSPYSEKLHRR